MKNDISDFDEVKLKGEAFYQTLTNVKGPYFEGDIAFNALGFEHLHFKQREKRRMDQDQYMRFKLLHLAPEILKRTRTVQGILDVNRFEKVRINSRTEMKLVRVRYYEFIAVLDRNRVKVIVKRIGQGTPFFWSIIPFWGMDTETMQRILHEGDLEED